MLLLTTQTRLKLYLKNSSDGDFESLLNLSEALRLPSQQSAEFHSLVHVFHGTCAAKDDMRKYKSHAMITT